MKIIFRFLIIILFKQTIHLVQEDPYYEKIPYQSYQVNFIPKLIVQYKAQF